MVTVPSAPSICCVCAHCPASCTHTLTSSAKRRFASTCDASTGSVVPFYLLPSLGGKNTLRGYLDYRFHDRHMQAFSAESRWGLFTHLDAAIFADFGKVAATRGDLNFKDLKTSYGAGLRLHNRTYTFARLDFGRSTEGWRILAQMSDPFKRSTLSGSHTAVLPFVP